MTDYKTDEEDIAFAAAYSFLEGMSTTLLRDHFLHVIQENLCNYRDHILNAVQLDDDGSIVEEVPFSRDLLEGDSDSYLYALTIIESLCDSCIEIEEMHDELEKRNQ